MKTILTTALLTVLTAVYTPANGMGNKRKNPIQTKISSAMTFPEIETCSMKPDFVIVRFAIDENGCIDILESNFSKNEFNEHVKSELSKIKFDPKEYKVGEKYTYKFSFSC